MTLKPGLGVTQGIGTDTYRSATYDFLLTFRGNYVPISYRFRDKRRFQPKIANGHVCFAPPIKGSSWNWVSVLGEGQKLESWSYRAEKDVWWYLQPSGYNTVHERGGQTDGRTDTADSKVRASTWRRAVKTTFAHTICTWLFQSEYGWTNSAELEFGRVPNQTRQLVQRIAKKILSNAGGHVPTSWRRHCCLSLPPSSF